MIGPYHQTRWIEALAEVDIPPYGCVRIKGADWENPSRTILNVDEPSVDSDYPIAVNSHKPIAAGDYGLVAVEGVVYVLYDDAATPANGESWGPQADSFEIKKGQKGFIILGDVDAEKGIVLVALVSGTGSELIGGCLAEDHAGRGNVFHIYLGVWNSTTQKWIYDEGTQVHAIDWRYGVPYPKANATGLFVARASDDYGTIWETVALDCVALDDCGD